MRLHLNGSICRGGQIAHTFSPGAGLERGLNRLLWICSLSSSGSGIENCLIGLGVFVSSHIRRHLIIRSNALFLHEYPFDDRDMIIEYNGLLAARNHEQAVYSKTVNHLFQTNRHCDEIFFSAMDGRVDLTCVPPCEVKFVHRVIEESDAQMVELDRFGQGVESYLATLSKNRRAQIRRSLRLYQELAPLKLREAGSIEEALFFFDGLKTLHTERWRSKGRGGSFAKSRWEAFHRSSGAQSISRAGDRPAGNK